jgi:hypothetical protein
LLLKLGDGGGEAFDLRLQSGQLLPQALTFGTGALARAGHEGYATTEPPGIGSTAVNRYFKKFLQEVVLLPCQVVRAGRRLVYRLLQWNPWVDVLCRAVEVVRRLCFG